MVRRVEIDATGLENLSPVIIAFPNGAIPALQGPLPNGCIKIELKGDDWYVTAGAKARAMLGERPDDVEKWKIRAAPRPSVIETKSVDAPQLKLFVRDKNVSTASLNFTNNNAVVIGRESPLFKEALEHETDVSARHLEIYKKGDEYWANDKDSTNGTYLNDSDKRLTKPIRLKHDDTLRIGEFARLRFYDINKALDEISDVSTTILPPGRVNSPDAREEGETTKNGPPKSNAAVFFIYLLMLLAFVAVAFLLYKLFVK
ncbi:MAG: FHA domain-containing protein [Planctomycetes bacterium]|nr:FHA domain-containing protein [Planctomycetota bacterium]